MRIGVFRTGSSPCKLATLLVSIVNNDCLWFYTDVLKYYMGTLYRLVKYVWVLMNVRTEVNECKGQWSQGPDVCGLLP